MMATPDTLPSDLTLEIGDNVSPDDFLALSRAFFGYIKELSATVTPDGEHIHWTVQVKEGSGLIGVNPAPASAPEIVRRVYAKAANSVHLLERGQLETADLPEAVLKHIRVLSDMTLESRDRRRNIRLWIERKPIQLDESIGRLISEDWRAAYTDFGIVEGRLRTIQDSGKLEFHIRDDVLRQTVRCFFPEDMLPQAFENFRKRVEVSGMVHYRRSGIPISIDVAQIEPLPDDAELPTANDVRGILGVA